MVSQVTFFEDCNPVLPEITDGYINLICNRAKRVRMIIQNVDDIFLEFLDNLSAYYSSNNPLFLTLHTTAINMVLMHAARTLY
jgi:hypothetical protein